MERHLRPDVDPAGQLRKEELAVWRPHYLSNEAIRVCEDAMHG